MKTILKKLVIAFGVTILLASPACSEPLQIVTLQYPPYQYEENGQLKGFVTAIVREVFARMEHPITITVYPFARSLEMVKYGEADAIFTAAKNPEREAFADFPREVLVDQQMSFFVHANSSIVFNGDLRKFGRYRIGVIIGYRYGAVFDEAVSTGILPNIQKVTNQEGNAKKLAAGRIDVWMCNREQAFSVIRRLGLSETIKELTPAVQVIPTYLAFSKKRNLGDLGERFSRELRKMKEDGTYDRIIADYWK